MAADLASDPQLVMNWAIAGFVLLMTAASRSKRLGAALGYQRMPTSEVSRGARVVRLVVAAVLTLLLAEALRATHVPFPTTIGMAVLAVLILGWEPLRARMRRRTSD